MRPDSKTAAICGLFCGICPAYPEQCHGCLSDKLTEHCVTCSNGFRDCAATHNATRCFECDEFPCERLEHFKGQHWENGICHHAEVIDNLTYMGEQGVDKWVEKQITSNTCQKCGKLVLWQEKNTHKC